MCHEPLRLLTAKRLTPVKPCDLGVVLRVARACDDRRAALRDLNISARAALLLHNLIELKDIGRRRLRRVLSIGCGVGVCVERVQYLTGNNARLKCVAQIGAHARITAAVERTQEIRTGVG